MSRSVRFAFSQRDASSTAYRLERSNKGFACARTEPDGLTIVIHAVYGLIVAQQTPARRSAELVVAVISHISESQAAGVSQIQRHRKVGRALLERRIEVPGVWPKSRSGQPAAPAS